MSKMDRNYEGRERTNCAQIRPKTRVRYIVIRGCMTGGGVTDTGLAVVLVAENMDN